MFSERNLAANSIVLGCALLLVLQSGCMKKSPDYGLAPVTPSITLRWPVSGDTVYPGQHAIQYEMDDVQNATSLALYVNDSLVATFPASTSKKKPDIVWDVDTTLLDRRVSYSIAAYDLDSNKATSAVMSNILVAVSPTAPYPPQNLKVFSLGRSSVNLTWDDESSNETSYEVWKKTSTGPYELLQTLPANSRSTNDTGIVTGIGYGYKVRAVNSYGYADSREALYGADIVVMNPPTNVIATALGTKMVLLQWEDNSSGELAFVIERRTTSGVVYTQVGLAGPNETSYLDTVKLLGSSSYTYRIAARGQFEQSTWSNDATVLTLYIDTYPPTNLTATVDKQTNTVKLSWKNNTIYDKETHIERRQDPGGRFEDIGKVGTGVTTYSDTTARVNSAYTYQVRVLSVDGHYTTYSNTASVDLTSLGSLISRNTGSGGTH
jgi:uncharacterized protein